MNGFLPFLTGDTMYYLLFLQGSAPVGGIHNCKNKSITAISLAQLLFHQHNCKFLRRNSTDKQQNRKCNVATANEMSQLQFEWHNCKNKIAENVPCFLKSRYTSNFIFRSNYYLSHLQKCFIFRRTQWGLKLMMRDEVRLSLNFLRAKENRIPNRILKRNEWLTDR